MNTNNDQIKEKLVHRLKRIEGQVRGVQTMVNEDRQCREILQQLTAIRSAVMSVSTVVLENYMTDCLLNLDDKSVQERQELMDDMIQLINKAS
jgi:DNA-binding FrmR family transcriptional regulator